MRFFRLILAAFKAYDYRDKVLTALGVCLILLMILKMILFPFGFFSFGESNIYTEGLVAKNGIQNINPLFVDYNEADSEVSRLVFSGLMKYDPVKRAIVDDMASLSISEDKTKYTFKMRDGLKWHDGKPLTADDVYFTFHDVIMDDSFQNEILKTNFAGVEITLVDPSTIEFTLQNPNIFFVTNFTVGVLPQHVLKDVPPYDLLTNAFNKMPVGSGPYVVTEPAEFFPDGRTQITLSRNQYYYGDISDVEFMRFIVYPEFSQLSEAVNSVNGVVKVTSDYFNLFKDNKRFELMSYELPQYTAIFMNMESKLLKDNKNVRLALAKAVDKEKLIALFDDKKAVDTPLMELNQEDWVFQPSMDQANGALKDAGFHYANDDVDKQGIRYDDDENALELNLIARFEPEGTRRAEENAKVLNFLSEAWESIGFSIQVELLDSEEFKSRVMSRGYDLLFVGQSLGYNLDTYSYWHSTQANPSGQNLSNYKSFGVDALIEDIRSVFNPEKRARELNELAGIIKEDIPAIFLYRPVYYYATDGKVGGINMDGVVFPSDRFSSISNWKFIR